jgi:protein-S-isoprenylcysteine O-methyltransferase Ste14
MNCNLENMVRIQTARGHAVATSGPYAVGRHPMYVGLFCSLPGAALVLGSAWALVAAAAAVVMLTVRTHFEDRTLMRRLPGDADYAQRTRYRLQYSPEVTTSMRSPRLPGRTLASS